MPKEVIKFAYNFVMSRACYTQTSCKQSCNALKPLKIDTRYSRGTLSKDLSYSVEVLRQDTRLEMDVVPLHIKQDTKSDTKKSEAN